LKKVICILLMLGLLSGCSGEVFETIGNVVHVGQEERLPRVIAIRLPADATVLTSVGEDRMYVCNGYTMSLQTLPGGDLNETVRTLSGYEANRLTVVKSRCGDHDRYDWVWVATGECGDVLCRAAVLDDGNYHYALTAVADENVMPTDAWNGLFSSFCLETNEDV
jgi:hypothetical protein